METIEKGICQCVREPNGFDGLDGYKREYVYWFKRIESKDPYYQIFFQSGSQYQTCGIMNFLRFFEIKERFSS